MKAEKILITLLLLFISLSPIQNLDAQDNPEMVRIGIICDTINEEVQMPKLVLNEVEALLGLRYDIYCPEDKIVIGDFNRKKLERYTEKFMSDNEIDIIIGIGFVISDILAKGGPYPKPVITVGVVHPVIQGIPLSSENTSGVKNLSYLMMPFSIQRDLNSFYSIYPHKQMGFLIPKKLAASVSGINEYLIAEMKKYDVTVHTIEIDNDYQQSIKDIQPEIDAVYVGPLWEYSKEELSNIANLLIEKKLPTFALFGADYVAIGFLAGAAPGSNVEKIGRRIALNIEKILNGDDPANFPVTVRYQDELVVNMRTARQIDFYPSFSTLAKAKLLYEEDIDHAKLITLQDVIAETLKNNINLNISKQEVLAGEKDVRKSSSQLFPQIDASVSGVVIDKARAEASFGMNAERTTMGSGQASQIIFSEATLSNIKVQRILQESRKHKFTQDELDIILQTLETYINVLKAQTYEKIQRENLNLTQKHLDISRLRQEIGFSGLADVYRWESEIESVNIELVKAKSKRRSAEISLNEFLNRPLDEYLIVQDLSLYEPFIVDTSFTKLIYNTKLVGSYFRFLVKEALLLSPEIKQIDLAIEARERMIKSVKSGRYLPSVGIQAGSDYIIDRSGAGTEVMDPIEIPGMDPISFGAELKDYQWDIGIVASIPIFQGGYKKAEIQQMKIQLSILEMQKADLENKISQRVLTSLEAVLASRPTIEMSKRASEAAIKSLQMSQDAYSKGMIGIVDLIDVQNAATKSSLYAENAVYDYLLDFLYVSRAVGGFRFMYTDEDMLEMQKRFLEFE